MQKFLWFLGGLLIGLTALSITKASVLKKNNFEQSLSEIRVRKEGKINFDHEIEILSREEPRFREKLPLNLRYKMKHF